MAIVPTPLADMIRLTLASKDPVDEAGMAESAGHLVFINGVKHKFIFLEIRRKKLSLKIQHAIMFIPYFPFAL